MGCAKDLCETIAKVVIAERGGIASGDDLPDLVNAAHKLLAFQPGEDIANDPDSRQIAAGLKSIVLGTGAMRNRHGTGHGRATPSGITANTRNCRLSPLCFGPSGRCVGSNPISPAK